jgi:hypothetical protein
VQNLENFSKKYRIGYFNIGTTYNPHHIEILYKVIKKTTRGFCSVYISDEKQIHYEAARHTARLIKKLSKIDAAGFANLRFAGLFDVKPGTPFFPAAYHRGPPSFSIGMENSDIVYKAFSASKSIDMATSHLKEMLTWEYNKIEEIAWQISKKHDIDYGGIDVSISPSIIPQESIAYAIEKLRLGRFGEPGTLTIAKLITDTLLQVKVKKCGYSGLMLPILEDYGLAQRNNDHTYNLINLLLYSAVCGTGLDTIPLPGNVSEEKLYALLLDIASLSMKLVKPLSARLMPIPHKKAG